MQLERLSGPAGGPSHPHVAGWVQSPVCVEGWGLAIAGHVPHRVMVQAFQLCAGDLVTAVQSQPHGVLGERTARHVFTQVCVCVCASVRVCVKAAAASFPVRLLEASAPYHAICLNCRASASPAPTPRASPAFP